MGPDHRFDWKGFSFSLKLFAAFLVVGVGVQYGALLTRTYLDGSVRAGTLAVESFQNASAALGLSSSTPERIINILSINEAVPKEGKFIAADLVNMKMYLYQDARVVEEYPILTKGRPKSPYETPSGFYEVLTKEKNHLNKGAQVYLPYSMQFYGNYFIHGWPYYADGRPVDTAYSGGCIRLSTEDAAKVFAFADRGTGIFVYDSKHTSPVPSLALSAAPLPPVSAEAYLVADIDTGDVLLEKNATATLPIASVTKLMTALVANETIMFDKEINVATSDLLRPGASTTPAGVRFTVGDLLYPLLMESNNAVATTLAEYYGTSGFIRWMNATAKSLGMTQTRYADPSGISPENISTPEDLYRLAVYLTNKKSFIWNISRTPVKTLAAPTGETYTFKNFNGFAQSEHFVGGKVGRTGQARETMVSVFSESVNGTTRRIAIIVLRSESHTADTASLAGWVTQSLVRESVPEGMACVACANTPAYRKISL